MEKKVMGNINSEPLAIMLLTTIAHVATDLKITLKDKINGQTIIEIDRNAEKDDIKKFIDCLTGDKSYRYSVEFMAVVSLFYLNKEFLEAFNVPGCCEIKIL